MLIFMNSSGLERFTWLSKDFWRNGLPPGPHLHLRKAQQAVNDIAAPSECCLPFLRQVLLHRLRSDGQACFSMKPRILSKLLAVFEVLAISLPKAPLPAQSNRA